VTPVPNSRLRPFAPQRLLDHHLAAPDFASPWHRDHHLAVRWIRARPPLKPCINCRTARALAPFAPVYRYEFADDKASIPPWVLWKDRAAIWRTNAASLQQP
jgi:hypothetical protein